MRRVLSLDGGGVRGIIQAYILCQIEKESERKLYQLFDLIVGTSTGALIALLIGSELTGDQILEIYLKESKTIFDEMPFSLNGMLRPRFDNSKFKKLAEKKFDGKMLYQLKTKVVCPAYCLDYGRPVLYRSFDPATQTTLCSEVAVAAAAAPTYFPPSKIGKLNMVDGGVFMNNPAAEAAATAFELFDNDFKLISIGNGVTPVCVAGLAHKNTGYVFWKDHILNIMFDGVSDLADDQCSRILGDKFIKINGILPGSINSDLSDHSNININRLIAFADDLWLQNKKKILKEIL